MSNSIFISYRRSDSQHAAIALADALSWAFAEGEVFFDRGSIRGADEWPDSIKNAAAEAKLIVVVIGDGWLRASDQFGRRRLDDSKDWVRRELVTAIKRNIEILPLTLDDASVPVPEALDFELERISSKQALPIRVSSWENDIHAVIERIRELTGIGLRLHMNGDTLNPNGTPIPRPDRKKSNEMILPLSILRQTMEDIPPWRFETNYHPWAIGGKAEEICRLYEFSSFRNATQFMADSAETINRWKPPHHPRWENQWRVIKVWFSTWDVGCRVTQLDIKAAKMMDKLFRDRDPIRCG